MRDLRNHGGDLLRDVEHGESLIVTRDGIEVAELRPLRRAPLSARELVARFRPLPPMDYERFRADVDDLFDTSL